MKTYSYTIKKSKTYGYIVSIQVNGTEVYNNGGYATKTMAYVVVRDWILEGIEQTPIVHKIIID